MHVFDKKAWSKSYYLKNKELMIEKKRLWRKKNPDKVAAENRRRVEKTNQWRELHKAEKYEYDKKRRDALRFDKNREFVIKRANNRCEICGASEKLHVHHKDGQGRNSAKPNNHVENLQVLCPRCHREAHVSGHWAKLYDQCRGCGSSELPHYSQGMCHRCYWLNIAKPKRYEA